MPTLSALAEMYRTIPVFGWNLVTPISGLSTFFSKDSPQDVLYPDVSDGCLPKGQYSRFHLVPLY